MHFYPYSKEVFLQAKHPRRFQPKVLRHWNTTST